MLIIILQSNNNTAVYKIVFKFSSSVTLLLQRGVNSLHLITNQAHFLKEANSTSGQVITLLSKDVFVCPESGTASLGDWCPIPGGGLAISLPEVKMSGQSQI